MKTRVSLKYFVNDFLWKSFFDSNLPQTTSELICLTNLVTVRPFTCFKLTSEEVNYKQLLKCALLSNYFSEVKS